MQIMSLKMLWCFVFLLVLDFQKSLGAQVNVPVDIRIVGGKEVDIKHRPFQVSIQYGNQHFCGGALITPDTVLSAAHCFGQSFPSMSVLYVVKVGSNTTAGRQTIQIQSVLVHPNYDADTIDSDISLIKLRSKVNISDTVQLIRISQTDNYPAGTYASVSGWGFQQENGTISPMLRKVDVPLTSRTQCQKYYDGVINITKNMVCAGFSEGGKDACQGDSGGPLEQNNKLIGVVSFGMGCARRSFPGVYTNVARFTDWVVKNSNYSTNYTYYSGVENCYANSVIVIITVIPILLNAFLF